MSADILRDLARAKAVFQLRAVEAVIRGPAQGTEAGTAETLGSVHDGPVRDSECARNGDAQKP